MYLLNVIFTSQTCMSAFPLTTSNSWVIHTRHSTKERKPVSAVLTKFPLFRNSSHFYQYSNKPFANGLEWKLHQVYMCRYVDGLTCWEKKIKTNPQSRALKSLETNIVHIHYSSYTSHKCNIPWRKLLRKGNPKRQNFLVLHLVR